MISPWKYEPGEIDVGELYHADIVMMSLNSLRSRGMTSPEQARRVMDFALEVSGEAMGRRVIECDQPMGVLLSPGGEAASALSNACCRSASKPSRSDFRTAAAIDVMRFGLHRDLRRRRQDFRRATPRSTGARVADRAQSPAPTSPSKAPRPARWAPAGRGPACWLSPSPRTVNRSRHCRDAYRKLRRSAPGVGPHTVLAGRAHPGPSTRSPCPLGAFRRTHPSEPVGGAHRSCATVAERHAHGTVRWWRPSIRRSCSRIGESSASRS
ncbi:hypothetical protein RKD18_008030 [Streptomyces phaeoluteigriseus]